MVRGWEQVESNGERIFVTSYSNARNAGQASVSYKLQGRETRWKRCTGPYLLPQREREREVMSIR